MTTETVSRRIDPDIHVFTISGRLHTGNNLIYAEAALRRLIADGARKIVVDLSALKFIDSAGIGMLVACNGEVERAGGGMRISGPAGSVAETLRTVHLDQIVPIDADTDSSVERLQHLAA